MKKTIKYILLMINIVLLLVGCNNSGINNEAVDTMVNESIVQTSGFSISSDSTEMNTSAKGTVFVKGVDGIVQHIQIIAWIEIDPNDWGGISFYVPDNWHISSIISSYPENEPQKKPEDYISIFTTADSKYKLNKMIEIGKNRDYVPTGGGIGTVAIDLILKDGKDKSETFNIVIGVGSDEKDGVKIENPDSISIEIPLSSSTDWE